MPDFIHLHNHSHYSLLDGAAKIDQIVSRCVDYGMDSFALTDHGNMFGVLEFYQEARKQKVKPIIGCEVYVANGSRFTKEVVPGKKRYFHLVLLAKNQEGYQNLLRLVSAGYIEGYYYRPRIDFELLQKYHKGLVAQTACLGGEVNQLLLKEDWNGAKASAQAYRELFKDDFYLEVQNHNIQEEDIARARMRELSDALAIPMVATNDIHYLDKDHVFAHDMYICIRDTKEHDPKNMRYNTDQLFFKTSEEMYAAFPDFQEACKITREIADKCDVSLDFETRQLPVFPIPDTSKAKTLDDYFEEVCRDGLVWRYGDSVPEGAVDRLEYEMGVIRNMGFPGYFLIVKDFIDYARQNDIRVGPGRGSAAGALVAYVMGITNIDPLEFDLLFERFLNPERVSMPDIDIDFEDKHRADVIEYVRKKYGEKNVAQIVTFGRLMTKAVIKDLCRVNGLSFQEADRFTKLVPDKMAMDKKVKLPDVRAKVPELDALIKSDPRYENMWHNASILEGMNRATGVHAAGVVITPGELEEFVPLQRAGGMDGDITTQWDGNWIDDIGLLKMDFLGLRALTVIKETQRRLKDRGIDFDIEEIPKDDKNTFELFGRGDTIGIFQFESSGMREYLKKLQPSRLDDLIAMNALYRPGPMDNIPSYIERRHEREEVSYLHPVLENYLRLTYGIIVYQEQVMQIAQAVGGFSLGQADQMRRAMGKKKLDIMANMKVDFHAGAKERSINVKVADEIWDLLERFASYGFNKSHSAAYAWLAYQTGYLKANYTAEFMAAVMTDEMHDTKKMVVFLDECRKFNLQVLPPEINQSFRDFHVTPDGIRFGFGAIKNVGDTAILSIVEARKEDGVFSDTFDFMKRVDSSKVNSKVLESLVQVGAFDSVDENRARLFAAIPVLVNFAQAHAKQARMNQTSLFGDGGPETIVAAPELEEAPNWDEGERLKRERELIGIFVSGHPLEQFREIVENFNTRDLNHIVDLGDKATVMACGMISEYRTMINRRDKKMGIGTIDDFTGGLKFMIFEEQLATWGELLEMDALVALSGRLSVKDPEDYIMIVEKVTLLSELLQRAGRRVTISIDSSMLQNHTLEEVERFMRSNPGDGDVFFRLQGADGVPVTFKSDKYRIAISPGNMDQLKTILSGHSVVASS